MSSKILESQVLCGKGRMNNKILASIAISIAVIVAAVAGIVITNNRAEEARELSKKAQEATDQARAKQKEAEANEKAEARKLAAEKAKLETKQAALEDDKLRNENLKLEAKAAEANARKRESDAKVAEANAKAAADQRAAEKSKAEAAKAEQVKAMAAAKKAEENARAEEMKLAAEKAKGERVIAEVKQLELRKMDFEMWQTALYEKEQELNEREQALHLDKTAAEDLVWVAERDADVIGGETNVVKRKKKVLAENDPSLPVESRKLAWAERLSKEKLEGAMNVSSNEVVTILTRLYEEAIKADRIVEANFYLQNIRVLYPGWVYRPTEEKKSEDVNQKKKEE